MQLRKHLVMLPTSLRIMFFVFLSVPALAWQFGESPWSTAARQNALVLSLVLAAYWILPLLMCTAILVRHFWFLPVFLVQCLALAVHCIVFRGNHTVIEIYSRILLILAMLMMTPLFIDKDFAYPFLSRGSGFWRRARRIKVCHPIFLLWGPNRARIPAELQDCSLTGMGITVDTPVLSNLTKQMEKTHEWEVELHVASERYLSPVRLIWFDRKQPIGRMGLKFINPKTMAPAITALTYDPSIGRTVGERLAYYWLQGGVQQTALVLWVLVITGAFFLSTLGF